MALPWNEHIGQPALEMRPSSPIGGAGIVGLRSAGQPQPVVLTLPRSFSSRAPVQATGSTPPPRLIRDSPRWRLSVVVVSPERRQPNIMRPASEIALCSDEAAAIEAIEAGLTSPERRIERRVPLRRGPRPSTL